MNILGLLETVGSQKQAATIALSAGNDKKGVEQLLKIFLTAEPSISQRAAWCLNYLVRSKVSFSEKQYGVLLKTVKGPGLQESLQRMILKLLLLSDPPPKKFQGILMDCCLNFIEEPTTKTASAGYAFRILLRFCSEYPDIIPHVLLIIESRLPTVSPGFRSAAKNFINCTTKYKRVKTQT